MGDVVDREKLLRSIRFAIASNVLLESRDRLRLLDWFDRYPDELAARIYIEKVWWPNGPVCPICKSRDHIGSGKHPYRCNACDRQFTVRIGTILEGSHIPLHKWLLAILMLGAAGRKKISSLKLAELLGIRQPSAWSMIRRIRAVWPERDDVFKGFFESEFLDFGLCPWPFFTGRVALFKKRTKAGLVLKGDAYSLAAYDILPLPYKPFSQPKFFARKPLSKAFLQCLKRRRENTLAHEDDHFRWIPFKLPQRECPICLFGIEEWRAWEGPAVFFSRCLWEEFWEWIQEGREMLLQHRNSRNKWDSDDNALWSVAIEVRLRRANPRVRERYERLVRRAEEQRAADREKWSEEKLQVALAAIESDDVLI